MSSYKIIFYQLNDSETTQNVATLTCGTPTKYLPDDGVLNIGSNYGDSASYTDIVGRSGIDQYRIRLERQVSTDPDLPTTGLWLWIDTVGKWLYLECYTYVSEVPGSVKNAARYQVILDANYDFPNNEVIRMYSFNSENNPPDDPEIFPISDEATHFQFITDEEESSVYLIRAGQIITVPYTENSVTAARIDFLAYDQNTDSYVLRPVLADLTFDNLYSFDNEFFRQYFVSGSAAVETLNLVISPDTVYPSDPVAGTTSVRLFSVSALPIFTPEEIMSIETVLLQIYSAVSTLAKDITLQSISEDISVLADDPVTCEQLSDNTALICSSSSSLTSEITALKNSLDAIGEQVELHTSALVGIQTAGMTLSLNSLSILEQLADQEIATRSASETLNAKFQYLNEMIPGEVGELNEALVICTQNMQGTVSYSSDSIKSAVNTLDTNFHSVNGSFANVNSNLGQIATNVITVQSAVHSLDFDGIISALVTLGVNIEILHDDNEAGLTSPTIFIDNNAPGYDDELEIRSDDWDKI